MSGHTHIVIHTYTHTYTQDNYSNPRCACAPRVNHAGLSSYFSEIYGCCRNVTNQIMNKYKCGSAAFQQTTAEQEREETIQNTAHRTALTRLRVGSHRLAIELGRYHKPKPLPIKERL